MGGRTRAFSLKTIYLAALTVAFAVSCFAFALFDIHSQREQTQAALLEEARTFAREMDAVWKFMDNSQTIINTTSNGVYEFKGLHCAVVGKSVGALFSAGSDYAIRYTNFNPRNEQGIPDEFEAQALETFYADPSDPERFGIAAFEGEDRFRYVQALEVDESCLECHGDPQGEVDVTGYQKEGWELGGVGGAISIVIPIDQHQQALRDNVVRDIAFFLLITVVIGSIVYVATAFFVLRPLRGLQGAFGEMRAGRLGASLDEARTAKTWRASCTTCTAIWSRRCRRARAICGRPTSCWRGSATSWSGSTRSWPRRRGSSPTCFPW